jgi:hypothetical protein
LEKVNEACSADLQSAVSRIFNPLSREQPRPADCKSAIQQVANLRYDFAG